MPIRIEHGKPITLLTAAQIAGEERAAQQQLERTERLQAQQREFEYRTAIRQQDLTIDLQMQERAKLWEMEKMELRSRMDFEREEQSRQRKLNSIDSAIQQIDKEVLAGRITEQEAYPIKQKLEINKTGVSVPVSAFLGDEEDRFGVQPYWMRGRDAPVGTPERQLYEAKMAEQISGERRGVIPYYLDPKFLRELPPETAQDILMNKGIFFDSDEDFEAFLSNLESVAPTELPLGDKQLDVGVRAEEGIAPAGEGRIRVVSPEGQTGTILESELQKYIDRGFEVIGGTLEEAPETTLPPTTEDIREQLEAGKAKFYKPSLRTFATMSPLRYLMERRKAKKLVR